MTSSTISWKFLCNHVIFISNYLNNLVSIWHGILWRSVTCIGMYGGMGMSSFMADWRGDILNRQIDRKVDKIASTANIESSQSRCEIKGDVELTCPHWKTRVGEELAPFSMAVPYKTIRNEFFVTLKTQEQKTWRKHSWGVAERTNGLMMKVCN